VTGNLAIEDLYDLRHKFGHHLMGRMYGQQSVMVQAAHPYVYTKWTMLELRGAGKVKLG
jgi:hypothetical protein